MEEPNTLTLDDEYADDEYQACDRVRELIHHADASVNAFDYLRLHVHGCGAHHRGHANAHGSSIRECGSARAFPSSINMSR